MFLVIERIGGKVVGTNGRKLRLQKAIKSIKAAQKILEEEGKISEADCLGRFIENYFLECDHKWIHITSAETPEHLLEYACEYCEMIRTLPRVF